MSSRCLQCPRRLSTLASIVSFTEDFFADNAVDSAIRNVVDLAIEELFVNMVKYNTETEFDIELHLTVKGDGIKVTLVDHDVDSFDPTQAVEVADTITSPPQQIGGLGIFLVLKMVDVINYEYRDRVSTISFEKYPESS